MNKKIFVKTSLSMLVAFSALNVSALELGEYNGTSFQVGGFFKANGIFDRPDNNNDSFIGSAKETRMNVVVSNPDVEGNKVMGRIEYDLLGNTGSEFRLRQAFIKVNDLTLGKFVNGQGLALIEFNGEQFDVRGTGMGTAFGHGGNIRPDLVMHYDWNNFRFSVHDPVYDDANYPDFVAAYKHRLDGGHAFGGFISGREVRIAETDESEFGAGLGLGSKFAFGQGSYVGLTAYYGEGMGAYSGIGVDQRIESTGYRIVDALGTNDRADSENGSLVSQYGYSLALHHKFSEKVRSTARFGYIQVNDTADTTQKHSTVNLVYTPFKNLDVGVEWRDRSLLNHPTRPAGQQVEFMAMYKF